MRGVMFRAYMSFIKNHFDTTTLDKLLLSDDYPNKGGFSTLGDYKTSYLNSLITNSSYLFNDSKNKTTKLFGKYAFKYLINRVLNSYGKQNNITKYTNPYDFLENLNTLHLDEIQKLYPNSKFPEFVIDRKSDKHIVLEYSSARDIPYLTYGLLEGCLEYYKDKSQIEMKTTTKTKLVGDKEYPIYIFEVFLDE